MRERQGIYFTSRNSTWPTCISVEFYLSGREGLESILPVKQQVEPGTFDPQSSYFTCHIHCLLAIQLN